MFVVECDPDIVLVSSLASVSRRRIEHVAGKPRVIRKLMRNYENSVGMIDEDPNSVQPPDIQRFKEIEFSERHKIRILHHYQRNNRLVILCPRLEEWIVEAAREVGIDMNKYNLPNDPIELHAIINIRTNGFHRLIQELSQMSLRIKALRTHLKE